MVTESSLNRIVKGTSPTDTKVPVPEPLPPLAIASAETLAQATNSRKPVTDDFSPTLSVNDPALASLPSSPPQIYLNLLILEASLRSQYLHLLSRRRLNTFFLLLLALWNAFFTWALFLRPREDGTGLGGSVYWVIETGERLAFMGGVATLLLVKATGQWERGIRWPRRWLGTTNRGLRGFNLRVVVVKRRWWREALGYFAFLLPFGLWREAGGSDWHLVEHENGVVVEEDLARGGTHLMLLLLPKNFSSEFRENWEAYRTEYWERENERRLMLRKKVKVHRRNKAREHGGWKWWTGLWRLAGMHIKRRGQDLEKHPQNARYPHGLPEKEVIAKNNRRRSLMRDGSHSRQSSRSSTPQLGPIDGDVATEIKPLTERVRRGSSVSSTSSVRKSFKGRRADGMLSPLTSADDEIVKEKARARKRDRDREKERSKEKEKNADGDSRPTTPNADSRSDVFAKRVPAPT